MSKYFIQRLDLIAAGVVAGIGVIILLLSYLWRINQQDIGIVLLLAPLAYLMLKKRGGPLAEDTAHKPNRTLWLLAIIIFCVTFAASLLVLKFGLYHRPPVYFVLVSIAAASIAAQILFAEEENNAVWVILLQIAVLSLSVRAGIFYEFPTLIGTDTWFHARFADFISGYGYIPSREVYDAGQYNSFPLFHILIAVTKLVTGASLKDATFFSVIFPGVIGVLVIYPIGKHIAGIKVGLFAALVAGFADMILVSGVTNINPGSLVLVWFILIVLLLYYRPSSVSSALLIMFLFWAMVITHQLTVFTSLMAFIGLFVGKWLFEHLHRGYQQATSIPNLNLRIVLFFIVSLIFYWMTLGERTIGHSFFDTMVSRLLRGLTSALSFDASDSTYANLAGGYTTLSNVLYHGGYLILLFLAVLGALIWLFNRNINGGKVAIITAILALYVFIYGTPLTSLEMIVIPHRWLPFAYVFLVLPAACAIVVLSTRLKQAWGNVSLVAIGSLLLIFFMITTPYVTNGSAIYDQDRAFRTGYKQSEMQAAATIVDKYGGNIMIDREYSNAFTSIEAGNTINLTGLELDIDASFRGIILLRRSLIKEPTQISSTGTFGRIRSVVLGQDYFDMVARMPNSNLVYDNGEALGYLFR